MRLDCDCGTIYKFTGRLNEDELLDMMDFLDDMDAVNIKSVKKDGQQKNTTVRGEENPPGQPD